MTASSLYNTQEILPVCNLTQMTLESKRATRDHIALVGLADVEAAADRLRGRIIRTPLLTSDAVDEHLSALLSLPQEPQVQVKLCFKAEHLQVAGAFKSRGAGNAIQICLERLRKADTAFDASKLCVLTHSSGNHAAALALQAKLAGVQAAIVMPSNAPQIKKDNTASHGARIWFCEPTQDAREEMARKVQRHLESEGLVVEFIHPYDDPAIIAGQGTMGREMMLQAHYLEEVGGCSHAAAAATYNGSAVIREAEKLGGSAAWNSRVADAPPLDIVIAPVGGGGMLSGVATAVKGVDARTLVVGAEPKAVDDALRSLQTGILQPSVQYPNTICDGLLTSLSDLTLAHIERRVDLIASATETNVVLALKTITESMKQIIEPSAAIGLAVLLEKDSRLREMIRTVQCHKAQKKGQSDESDQSVRIGIVWSGGNATVQSIAEHLSKA